MRQRKIKDLDCKLQNLSEFIVSEPEAARGKWNEIFGNNNPIFVEIGCGKGQFINAHSMLYPNRNYVGIEGQDSVILRALEKTAATESRAKQLNCDDSREKGLSGNIMYINKFVGDITEIFASRELCGVYLNFSDPWPKDRHAKRRLMHVDRLRSYFRVLEENSFVEIKTDNEELFEFALMQIKEGGHFIEEITRDLKASEFKAKNITTEYEDKFMLEGKNINYVKIRA
ncbi:MAG: tRNA (guanosine(46)-N7)-methyltransferase TrmB [Eubacteriales bacterium]|nr:tRNA (guanosine(46)-N7)-methyltransferase TrmB [Eubacteriales bacterium]MDD4390527.1 tRNA (guanosine(46)-N7)-methyltransferase TrmB [Eubacteriales bacterium]